MGNRRSVEKALAHVGARACVSADPRRSCARPPASCCPASARSRARWSACASSASTSCCASASRAGTPVLGDLPRHAARLRALHRARRRRRAWASSPARCARCAAGALKLPAHRLERGAASTGRDSPLLDGLPRALRLLPRALLRAGARRDARTCSATAEYGAPFATAVAQGLVLRRAVPPGEVLRGRPAAARQLRPHLPRAGAPSAAATARVKLYPAIDILDGNAVRLVQGRLRRAEGLRRGSAVGGARLGRSRARAPCTWSTSTARGRGDPVNLGHVRRIATRSGVPVQYGGGLRSRAGDRGRARRRRRARDPRHGGLHRPELLRAGARREHGPSASSCRSTCAAGGSSHGRLDERRRRSPCARSSRACIERGCERARLHRRRPRRDARRASIRTSSRAVARTAADGRADLLGRHRRARRPASARALRSERGSTASPA